MKLAMLDGTELRIEFTYGHGRHGDGGVYFYAESVKRNAAQCEISGGDPCTWATYGTSICGDSDRFSRKIGRKLALMRALGHGRFTKPERANIWRQYFGIVRDLKGKNPKTKGGDAN